MFINDVREAEDILSACRFDSPNVFCARGWLELMKSGENKTSGENAQTHFEEALAQDGNYIEAFFGQSRCGEITKKTNVTQNAVNEIQMNHPEYVPGLLEKCRMSLLIQDFAQLSEVINDTQREERNNLIAHKYWALYGMVSEGSHDLAQEKYERLSELIAQTEPTNSEFMIGCAKVMSRICGRSNAIINISIKMLEKCKNVDATNVETQTELAYNYLMVDEIEKAYNHYKDAASLDMAKPDPIIGMIRTQILKHEYDDAESQLEFLNEICSSMGGKTAEIAYLEGQLWSRKSLQRDNFNAMEENLKGSNKALDEALKLHIMASKAVPYSFEFYIKLNPDFLLSLAQEFLYHSDFSLNQIKERIQNPTSPTHLVGKAAKLLDTVVKRVYGLIPGYMLASKAKLINGNINGAKLSLEKALQFDPKNEEAHILNAIIVYSNGNLEAATNSIKEALANNFEIINNPFFMLVKGQIEIEKGELDEGLKTLIRTYNLPGVKNLDEYKKAVKNKYMTVIEFSENVRAQIFIMTSKAYALNNNFIDCKKVMEEGIVEFAGSDEEPVILLGNADLAILQNDLKKALGILKSVEPTAKGYMVARKKLADIYLKNMCQRRQYAKCYYDLAIAFPTFENYLLYGDALMNIQEPEEAKLAYEEAKNQNPENEIIIRKIGKAMACTHNYQEAIKYYEDAIYMNNKKNVDQQLDHAKLQVKLNHLDKATEFQDKTSFVDEYQDKTLEIIKRNIDGLITLSKLHKKRALMNQEDQDGQNIAEYLDCLTKAYNQQQEAIERAKYEGGKAEDERKICSEFAENLANVYIEFENNIEKAYEFFKEAFKYNNNNYELILAMADINMLEEQYEDAEEKCKKVLNLAPNNPKALWILGHVLMAQNEIEKGVFGFAKVYKRDETNFIALALMFMFMRKNGKLCDIKAELDKINEKMGHTNEPGLCFCRGLYYYYRKNPQEALNNFQRARRSKLYSEYTLQVMIDIYLNPDQDILFSHVENLRVKTFDDHNLDAVEVLINELPQKTLSEEKDTLTSYLTMFKDQAYPDAEKVLEEILEENPKFIPALNAQALLRVLRKNVGGKPVKDILRNMSKGCTYNPRWGEECERCWILVADYLISINKLNIAEKEIQKILKYNQSSIKAYEYYGIINEKMEKWEEAAEYYMQAWAITEELDNGIGYRLAGMYLKSNSYVQCINICKKVSIFV